MSSRVVADRGGLRDAAAGVLLGLVLATLSAAALGGQSPASSAVPTGTALIAGRVVDAESGAPVPNAIVTLALPTNVRTATRVLTSGSGEFFFGNLGAGTYTVSASKPGWLSGGLGTRRPGGTGTPLEVRATDRRGDLVIDLWRPAVVTGRVTDDHEDPLVGADVRILQETFAAGHRQWTYVSREITDDLGVYRFSALAPGDYLVMLPATVLTEPLGRSQSNEMFLRTMTAVGAAPMNFSRIGMPVRGTSLVVSSILNLPAPASADRPWSLFPTTYFPAATNPGAATLVRAVSGHERTGIDIAVRLARTFQVAGTLALPDGSAAANYAIHLLPANSAPTPVADIATAVTDSRGTFTFFGVPSGSYIARVVRMPKAAGAEYGQCGGTGAVSYVCVVERYGPLGAPPAAAGVARDDGLAYVDAPVTVSDADVRALSLVLRDGAHVSGRIEFAGDTPRPAPGDIQRIAVLLEPADGRSFSAAGGYDPTRPAVVSETGEFSTPGTWPGRYLVRASGLPRGWMFGSAVHGGRDVSDAPMDLSADASDVVIRLVDKPSRLTGSIQTSSVSALRGATVVLFPTNPAGWVDYGRSSRRVATAPVTNGRYTFTGTPAGDYFLAALADEDLGAWQNPEVLKRLATVADRVTVNAGDVTGPALRVQTRP